MSVFLFFLFLSCAPSRDGKVRIEFWGLGREGEVVAEMIPEFERRHPGIEVDVQQIPWTAAHEKLLTAHVGDATPDVAQMGNTWVPEFAAVNALEPLDGRLDGSVVERSDYFRGIWDTNVVDERLYGIPWYVDTRILFYRTDILAAAGWARPPETWDEWVAAMESVKTGHGKGSANRFAILLPTNEWQQPIALGLQAGSTLLKNGNRNGAFSDPEFARAFEFYVGLFRRGYAPALSNTQVANLHQQFGDGDFAMYITGPWNVGEFKRRLPASLEGKWATAPLPAPTGSKPPGVSLAGGSSLVLFAASAKKDAAWALIEFLSEPAQQKRLYELCGDLPARRSAWDVPSLARDPYLAQFGKQLENVQPTPQIPEWEQIATAVFEHAESAIRGEKTTAQALAMLDRKANNILEKRRWVLDRAAKAAAGGGS